MKRYGVWFLLVAAAVLGGCSAYHRQDAQSAAGPEIEIVETETAGQPGPVSPDAGAATVPALEMPETEASDNPEILIASDIHYLAKELTDFGQAFQNVSDQGDGKLVSYVWEITDAFLNEVIRRRPQALILLGDLSLEGERSSHEALAQKLRNVENAGIEVAVLPGNHDINNVKAAGYKGGESVPAERTTPEDFASIYGAFGYEEAISRDPASLSYLYELPDGTWLLMLDSCQYEGGALIGGMIRTETYEWIEEVLDLAWYEDRQVIAAAHHNLLDESRIYEENCTIEHSEELQRRLSDWGVSLFLSGHLHVQHYKRAEAYEIDEIVTGSLIMSPCQYGVLEYQGPGAFDYHTERTDVSAWAETESNPDVNLQDFASYADEFLQSIFYRQAMEALQQEELSEKERADMAELYAIANVYAVAGRAVDLRQEVMEAPAYDLWQNFARTSIQAMYLNEIIEDAVCNYNVLQRP